MQVHYLEPDESYIFNEDLCLAIGFFDGLHLGHQSLISEVKRISKEKNLIPAVMCFNEHPLKVLKAQSVTYLTSTEDRIRILDELGIKHVFIITFTKAVASLSPQDFIDRYLNTIHVKHLVCGFDFRFGHMNTGGIEDLKTQKFSLSVMKPVMYDETRKVSSTLIKQLLEEGNVKEANRLLTRPYKITGCVIHGKQRGRLLGFPTANIEMHDYASLKRGVYGVLFDVDGETYHGMANVGMNPTFHDINKLSLEVHIFNFDRDIYDKKASVRFYTFTREEHSFNNVNALKARLTQDKSQLKEFFKKEIL